MDDPYEAFRIALQPEEWMQAAACRGLDPNLFQLEQGQSARKPRETCDTCKVEDDCLEYALRTGSVGVWGGEVLDLKSSRQVQALRLGIQDARPQRVAAPKRRTDSAPVPVQRIAARRRA